MRTKLFFHIMLIMEAVLIILQLATKNEAWTGMICFWSIVIMENISDIIDERNDRNDGNGRSGGNGQHD